MFFDDIVKSGLSQKKIGEKHGIKQVTVSRRKAEFIEKGYVVSDESGTSYTDKGKEWLKTE